MRKKILFIGLFLSTLLVSMYTTILNTTGPIIIDDLGGLDQYAWIFAVYMLTSTVSIPIFGKLSDRIGRKKVFIISLVIFLVFNILCGFADSMTSLIIFRAVKGIGAGGVIPTSQTILGDLLEVEKRARFQGYMNLLWGISAVTGPIVGSLIVEFMDWRWIFFLNIPIALLSLVSVLPYKEKLEKVNTTIAWWSALFFSIATISALAITINYNYAYVLIPVAIISFVLFNAQEKKSKEPFLPMDLLKNPHILFFNLNTFLFFFALFGLESFIPYFLQEVQGATVLWSGIALSGISLGWFVSSYPSGVFIKRIGYKKTILIGNAVIAFSSLPFLFYTSNTFLWITFIILFFHGISYGLIQTVGTIGSYEFARDKNKGLSTSLQTFSRNIGTSFSLGYMGSLVVVNPYYILYAAVILSFVSLFISLKFSRNIKA